MSPAHAIEVQHLHKHYGTTRAVDGLSFSVEAGEVFALVGPNGAGKTTVVEILEGHRRRTSGRVDVLGFDPATGGRAYREQIGIVLQEAGVDEDFSPRELVRLYRGMYPRQLGVDEVIELVGLADKADAKVKTLSGGQRRRLDLALGLVGDPELLFLDEPTTGFDPSARRRAWELVENLRGLGKTVLLTTHYMDEAEHLADRVAVMVAGRLVSIGTPAELGGARRSSSTIAFRLPLDVVVSQVPDLGAALQPQGGDWQLRTTEPTVALERLLGWARSAGVEVSGLTVERPSLEDVYLELIEEAGVSPVEAHTAPVGT
ncbi:ABC transporter ATP-binding protein [Nocardioides piscis]|uniref:ABC transporter ATP-binding protein n=1 Tax=Nocardioides piscis TaxID=2714938 RepID=A0A6G7YII4_9ACTN|nr:ABC transporter ATP-binding protein [Nocardioides piscis]QIK76541.1 ABC transporter ATP-binding protein [Nocardioides piscis]